MLYLPAVPACCVCLLCQLCKPAVIACLPAVPSEQANNFNIEPLLTCRRLLLLLLLLQQIVISWFLSPLAAALIALIIFVAVRTVVLRRPNSTSMAFYVLPLLILITIWVNLFFILVRPAAQHCSISTASMHCLRADAVCVCSVAGKNCGWLYTPVSLHQLLPAGRQPSSSRNCCSRLAPTPCAATSCLLTRRPRVCAASPPSTSTRPLGSPPPPLAAAPCWAVPRCGRS